MPAPQGILWRGGREGWECFDPAQLRLVIELANWCGVRISEVGSVRGNWSQAGPHSNPSTWNPVGT